MIHICESYQMAVELLEDDEGSPCYEIADRELDGYWLCEDCAWALEIITGMAHRIRAEQSFMFRFVETIKGIFKMILCALRMETR